MAETAAKKKAPKGARKPARKAAAKRSAASPKKKRETAAAGRPAAGATARTLVVVQVHSGIGCTQRQKGVLRSLGLRGPHDRRSLPDVPSVRGMVAAVPHLVRLEEPSGRKGTHA